MTPNWAHLTAFVQIDLWVQQTAEDLDEFLQASQSLPTTSSSRENTSMGET